MLQTQNNTPFATGIGLFPDENGVDSVYPAVKATFTLESTLCIAENQLPLIAADEYHGDPASTSLKSGSEISFLKPATDVTLAGCAYAPDGRPCEQVDVSLSINGRGKTVRVFGDRFWINGALKNKISEPEQFTSLPLIYERAFGGCDTLEPDGRQAGNMANPVGAGFWSSKGTRQLDGLPLPNLENPADLITSIKSEPAPAGFGPLCSHWEPRLRYAGTYDESWLEERAPYLPDDFDLRFFNNAHPDLIFDSGLEGGEKALVINATSDGRLEFSLPRFEFDITLRIAGVDIHHTPKLDTVFIEPEEKRLTMIWRCKQSCDKKTLKMELATFDIVSSDKTVKGH